MIISILVCLIGFCLSGCEKTTDAENNCTLNVISSYGGWGIDGQNLGSGSFSDTFAVSSGDVVYEDYYGHWISNSKNDYEEIITITEISSDGVVIRIEEEEITLQYDSWEQINSQYVVDDGRDYAYIISFSRDIT